MNRFRTLSLALLIFTSIPSIALKTKKTNSSVEIQISKTATHLVSITNDTLVLITGSTYLFTVDTPEDKGLVSTKITPQQLPQQIISKDGTVQKYQVSDKDGLAKTDGELADGDKLLVTSADGKSSKTYHIVLKPMAVGGLLQLQQENATVNTATNLTLFFTAGQRTPNATVRIFLPAGIQPTLENTTVNVIGRGDVKLKDLPTQSIGRVGGNYSYSKVGSVNISQAGNGAKVLTFSHLDLRPANGPDLKIVINGAKLNTIGKYTFRATYTTGKPEILTSAGIGAETNILTVTSSISDFERVLSKDIQYKETTGSYTRATFSWGVNKGIQNPVLMQSLDNGKSWKSSSAETDSKKGRVTVTGLQANKLYHFKLLVKDGPNKGSSNVLKFYTGKMDVKSLGVKGDGKQDDTQGINAAIATINKMGGGTLLFSAGTYHVRTVQLKSNVYLFLNKDATIKAIKGADAPESTWFSDKKYRSGLSPTAPGPYADPENYMTKQDVGHHYFRNTMFFGERLDNVKIIGRGLITGDGNLVNGDGVMNNAPDNRADKMFTLKLCTNLEIGGIHHPEDLWYDESKDEPYYIQKDGSKSFDHDNMLKIERAGHFVLLATGTDHINVHDTYFAKFNSTNARDIYDFMGCNNVTVTNIYSKVSSDDIVKPGSDCSLGFTRPARNYKVRNIIGDTNCNLFQIGSETADDIKDICVDNIYVLGANKAGFSISTNDGAHISDIHLNCGHTGKIHSRSKMLRTRAPFFISISNRARILGATVGRYVFMENGIKHDELLVKNVNIGKVENIILNGIDIAEVYGGSSHGGKNGRWKAYDGKQEKATPIIAGYKLPDSETVSGGLDFKLPNGLHTGYIRNIEFNDVHVLVKGGNAVADTANLTPELGVGQYNVGNLKVQPSYGIWARHVSGLTVKNSTFNYEKRDSRYPIFLDDVLGARLSALKVVRPKGNQTVIKLKNAKDVVVENVVYYDDEWAKSPVKLAQ
ncbi:glycosyl hydrolase family 28-related protein [Pedobacter heparinus]|uniref:glycosyl hydrolase family 28-related protein n=1 Tax=Pedobacter heparinus TaxID=984 RepID=UPI0029303436|nr:glycosyl hydrolase family 28-related protein [Pedobacter heparinus]